VGVGVGVATAVRRRPDGSHKNRKKGSRTEIAGIGIRGPNGALGGKKKGPKGA